MNRYLTEKELLEHGIPQNIIQYLHRRLENGGFVIGVTDDQRLIVAYFDTNAILYIPISEVLKMPPRCNDGEMYWYIYEGKDGEHKVWSSYECHHRVDDERYHKNGKNWFSSCSKKEDLLFWYSLEDAKELLSRGFVFTKYLAQDY